MRKITQEAYTAFINRRKYKRSNTEVSIENGDAYMYLFGNLIAYMEGRDLIISDGRYRPSNTTRERLSAFVRISISKGKFIVEGNYWDGKFLRFTNYFDYRN